MLWFVLLVAVACVAAPIIRANPVQPRVELEWHRGPTWLGCCAGPLPFVTLSIGQVVAIVVCSLAAMALAYVVGLDDGRDALRQRREVKRQQVAQSRGVGHG